MAINIRIDSSWDKKALDQAMKDIDRAKGKLGGLSGDSSKTSAGLGSLTGSLKKLGIAAVAAFGAREVGQFFTASIKGAIEDEKSLRVLNKTLSNMGFAGATQQVDEFISRLQFSAGIADDELRPALNNLVLATGNLSKSQELLQVSLDVSAGSGKDLDTITVALAKAYNGNYTALKKLNLGIDESLIKNKDLSGIITVLSQKFAGASANAVDTYAGKMQILKLAVGEAQESIGYGFLDAIERVSKALGKDSGGLANSIKNIGDEIALIIKGVGVLTAEVINASNAQEKSLKGLVATLFKEIFAGALTVPKWLVDFLQGKGASVTFAPDAGSMRASSRLAKQAKENQNALEKQTQATEDAKKAQDELKKNTESLIETNKNYAKFVAGTSPQSLEGATNLARNGLADIQKLMKGTPKINAGLVTSFKDLASVVQNNFAYALDQARTKLNQAKEQYDNFKNSIKGSITSIVNFGEQTDGLSFVANLEMQAEKAKNFGGQISKLLSMGLSQTALQQIADAGYDTGSVLAQQIIDGGSSVVSKVNQLVASVDMVGEQVSTAMADKFYGAGVNAAQNLVDGIMSEINRSAQLIADALANLYKGQQTVNTGGKGKKIIKKTDKKKKAIGGNVFPNTSYLVGEMGPEIFAPHTAGNIIPNNRIGSGGSNINITVNAGMGPNGALVGKQIVEAIKKYEKTSGQVFAGA